MHSIVTFKAADLAMSIFLVLHQETQITYLRSYRISSAT